MRHSSVSEGARLAPAPRLPAASRAHRTLQLVWSFSPTPLLTLGVVLALVCLAEVALRQPRFQAAVAAPGLGGRHHLLEMQVHYLNRLVRDTGRVDCIFLGNSMVWQGINVRAFTQRYGEVAGLDLTCYNFGVDGLPAAAAASVAQLLVKDYQPQLLIYGTDARDYAVPADAPDSIVVNEMAWLRYRNGQFSPTGWLYDHSYLLRYRGILRALARFDNHDSQPRDLERLMAANFGFYPDARVAGYVTTPPDSNVQDGPIAYYFGLLSSYTFVPENLAGLEGVLEQAQYTRVVVVEMPVPPTYMTFFGDGERDHQRFLAEMDERAARHGVPFLETTAEGLIADDGWLDYSHLNAAGAEVFSRWLGEKIAHLSDEPGSLAPSP